VRLFASSKDGDATKIGKFGIGFASVFSIRPEAVVVDTARGGERWRVVFSPDGTWKLFALDEALEGTRVRVLKRVRDASEQAQLVEHARATLSRWCRFADADIRFNGSSIKEPFDLEVPVRVTVPLDAPGDVAVVGLRTDTERAWGFYNKGLTLLEGNAAVEGVPDWVSFRVRDGALEHTITRENVIRDDAFLRVTARIRDIALGPLIDAALGALEGDHPQADAIFRALLAAQSQQPLHGPARAKRRPFHDARGARVSLKDVKDALDDERLVRVDGPGALADALAAEGKLVVRAPAGSGAGALLVALGARPRVAHDDYLATSSASEKEQWDAAPLLHALAKLFEADETPVADVVLGRIDDASGALKDAPFVVASAEGRPILRAQATALPVREGARMLPAALRAKAGKPKKEKKPAKPKKGAYVPLVVLNASCTAVQDALTLAGSDLWLAAFLLLRHMRADASFHAEQESTLALRALTLRSTPS
jgi:hypothetical protein